MLSTVRRWAGLSRKDAVSAPINANPVTMHPAYGLFFQSAELTPRQAWLLYENVATLAKVVDLIADQVASLDPLFLVNEQPANDNGALLAFFDRPGFNRDRRRYIKELTVQLLVTGTGFAGIYGNVQYTPSALDVFKSFYVTPIQGLDMWPAEYWFAEGTLSNRFYRQPGRDFRWINEQGLAEIVPIMDMDGNRRGVGLSRLSAVQLDVNLRLAGTEHNMNLMKNGATPSGIMTFKDRLSPDQKADVASMFRAMMTGPANAGKTAIFAGGESDYHQLGQTAKDMDWTNLQKAVEDAITTRYNVPITLFNTGAQTDNNYQTGWHQFYDNAVLPTFNIVWGGLSRALSDRIGVEVKVRHDTLKNNTLARQAAARALELRQGGLITTNEARTLVGYEPVLGGDALLAPAGEVPIGEDYFTSADADGLPLRNPPEPAKIGKDKEPAAEKRIILQ